jgi:hypothetical protein
LTGAKTAVTVAGIALGAVVILLAVALIAAHLWPDTGQSFRCNGTTGVYQGRDGAPAIQPYDPACGGAE